MPLPEWAQAPGLEWQHDDNYSALEVVWRNPRTEEVRVQPAPVPNVPLASPIGDPPALSIDGVVYRREGRVPLGQRRPILAGMIGGSIVGAAIGIVIQGVHLLWH